MTRDRSDDIRAAWERVKYMEWTPEEKRLLAREYLRLSGSVGEAACYAALGGIEAEIARLTCEELIR